MSESAEPQYVAAVDTFTVAFVSGVSPDKWVKVWAERMPHVRLILRPVTETEALQLLTDDVDMAFARFPDDADGHDDGVRAIRLWTETPVVVAPKDHAISVFDSVTLADIADEHLIAGDDNDTLDLVAAGVGVARMPQAVFRATGRRDVVGRPVSDAVPSRIALVWRPGRNELTDEFIGVVRGRTANSSRGGADAEPEKAPSKPAAKQPQSKKPAPKQFNTGNRSRTRGPSKGGKRRGSR